MQLPAGLIEGRLVRRYQRFFADVRLLDGALVTAHTPNTGSMLQCAVPGYRVLLSPALNPSRKLAWTLELIEVDGSWVDIHTLRANRVVEEGLRAGFIPGLADWQIRPEFTYRDSRIDFLLERGKERLLLEVKNVTLCDANRVARFPDAVTERGRKHLRDLGHARSEGVRTVMFYLVQRAGAQGFSPADEIDSEYGRALREAVTAGVEVMAWRTRCSQQEIVLERPLPVQL